VKIFLTALVTIIGGALTLTIGQIIVRGVIEPALELKRLIGTIAFDLDFQANKFPSTGAPAQQQAWRDIFRKHSCSIREKLNLIIWYRLFQKIFRLPPQEDVFAAAGELMGHSNQSANQPIAGLPGSREATIKRLLRIN